VAEDELVEVDLYVVFGDVAVGTVAGLHSSAHKVQQRGCRDRRSRWPPPWSTKDMNNAEFDTLFMAPRPRPAPQRRRLPTPPNAQTPRPQLQTSHTLLRKSGRLREASQMPSRRTAATSRPSVTSPLVVRSGQHAGVTRIGV